jgi:hypothetical protein
MDARDGPAGRFRGVDPRTIGDDERPRSDVTGSRQRTFNQIVEIVSRDRRLALVRNVDHEPVGSITCERKPPRVTPKHVPVRIRRRQRSKILPRPADHLPLRVDADRPRTEQRRLEHDPARATHRVDDRRAGPSAREIHERPRQRRVHAPGLEEGSIRRRTAPERRVALDVDPAEQADVGVVGPVFDVVGPIVDLVDDVDQPTRLDPERVLGRRSGIAGQRAAGEQRPEGVVGIVEVDREPAIREHGTEFALGALCVDPGGPADVPRANRDGPIPIDLGCVEQRPRAPDARVGVADDFAGGARERESGRPLGDEGRSRADPGRQDRDVAGGGGGLQRGEGVVLARELQPVHGRTSNRPEMSVAVSGRSQGARSPACGETVTYFQRSTLPRSMWPLGHVAGAYLLTSLGSERDWLPEPDAVLVVAVLLASQLPDLIDKPFAWFVPVLPAGRSFGHSLFFILPLGLLAILVVRRFGRSGLGLAITAALLSHLALDAVPALWGGGGWRFVLWPVLEVEGFNSPPSIVGMFEDSLDRPYFWAEFLLAGLALLRAHADGWPGVSWLFADDAAGPTFRRTGDEGD